MTQQSQSACNGRVTRELSVESLLPWQMVTLGSGLMLQASCLDLRSEAAALQAEFAAADAAVGPAGRAFLASDGSWSTMALVQRSRLGVLAAGLPTPNLEHMPSVAALLSRSNWTVVGCHLVRQPPHGTLPWHFEDQAPYSQESRLLVPIHAPDGAETLIGHESVAYPAGMGWTGDFNFPHQVENPTESQRIILIVDVVSGPEVRRLLPPALMDKLPLRRALAGEARNRLLQWRASRSEPGFSAPY